MDKSKAASLLQIIASMGSKLQYHIRTEKYQIYTYSIYNAEGENISHLVSDALQDEMIGGEWDLYIIPSIAGTLQHRVMAVRCNHAPQIVIVALGRVVYGDVGAYDG